MDARYRSKAGPGRCIKVGVQYEGLKYLIRHLDKTELLAGLEN